MSSQIALSGNQPELRLRATARLNARGGIDFKHASGSEALRVLFELASSPITAPDALALLHELQVHQVELEMQDEELRGSRDELEAALSRQTELYDFAPFSYFTVDAASVLLELNLTGARLLGAEREALLGRPLDAYLSESGADWLNTLLARVGEGHQGEICELELLLPSGKARAVQASASRDPAGPRFLLVFTDMGGATARSRT